MENQLKDFFLMLSYLVSAVEQSSIAIRESKKIMEKLNNEEILEACINPSLIGKEMLERVMIALNMRDETNVVLQLLMRNLVDVYSFEPGLLEKMNEELEKEFIEINNSVSKEAYIYALSMIRNRLK